MTFEQILALLTAKFSGVRKDGLAQMARTILLTVTTEAEAQALIDRMDVSKVTETVNEYRKDVDKEVSGATKTHETNLKKKYEFKEKAEPGKTDPPGDPNDIASIIKATLDTALKPLQDKLAGFEGQQVNSSRLQLLEGKLTNVPDTFKAQKLKDFKRMNFDTDEAFNEYLTETETDLVAFNQELADKGLSQQSKPMFGQQNKDGVSAGVASFIEAKTKPENSLGGKEV